MKGKPTLDEVRELAGLHPEVPEGVELFTWFLADPSWGPRVTVPVGRDPAEMIKEPQLTKLEPPDTVDLEPMAQDRHAGWALAYAWDIEHRVAVLWILES